MRPCASRGIAMRLCILEAPSQRNYLPWSVLVLLILCCCISQVWLVPLSKSRNRVPYVDYVPKPTRQHKKSDPSYPPGYQGPCEESKKRDTLFSDIEKLHDKFTKRFTGKLKFIGDYPAGLSACQLDPLPPIQNILGWTPVAVSPNDFLHTLFCGTCLKIYERPTGLRKRHSPANTTTSFPTDGVVTSYHSNITSNHGVSGSYGELRSEIQSRRRSVIYGDKKQHRRAKLVTGPSASSSSSNFYENKPQTGNRRQRLEDAYDESETWYATVIDKCDHCKDGEIRMYTEKEGTHDIIYEAMDCPEVLGTDGLIKLRMSKCNDKKMKIQVKNSKLPTVALELYDESKWKCMKRTSDNYFVLSLPENKTNYDFPMRGRATSITGQTVGFDLDYINNKEEIQINSQYKPFDSASGGKIPKLKCYGQGDEFITEEDKTRYNNKPDAEGETFVPTDDELDAIHKLPNNVHFVSDPDFYISNLEKQHPLHDSPPPSTGNHPEKLKTGAEQPATSTEHASAAADNPHPNHLASATSDNPHPASIETAETYHASAETSDNPHPAVSAATAAEHRPTNHHESPPEAVVNHQPMSDTPEEGMEEELLSRHNTKPHEESDDKMSDSPTSKLIKDKEASKDHGTSEHENNEFKDNLNNEAHEGTNNIKNTAAAKLDAGLIGVPATVHHHSPTPAFRISLDDFPPEEIDQHITQKAYGGEHTTENNAKDTSKEHTTKDATTNTTIKYTNFSSSANHSPAHNSTTLVNNTFCQSRTDGFYPVPDACSSFASCTAGIMKLRACPTGLQFNSLDGMCDWPQHVSCMRTLTANEVSKDDINIDEQVYTRKFVGADKHDSRGAGDVDDLLAVVGSKRTDLLASPSVLNSTAAVQIPTAEYAAAVQIPTAQYAAAVGETQTNSSPHLASGQVDLQTERNSVDDR